jgi:stress response protein YsnF
MERSGGHASSSNEGGRAVPGPDIETALDWRGRKVVDRDGQRIGSLAEIYLDEDERPSWASIDTGLFGLRQTLVPLSEARLEGDQVLVPYERDHVKDAPNVDPDVQLTPDEEERLYRHYEPGAAAPAASEATAETGAVAASRGGGEAPAETGAVAATRGGDEARAETGPAAATRGGDEAPAEAGTAAATRGGDEALAETAGDVEAQPSTEGSGDTADDAMTRSEEEVEFGTRTRERGRVRLKKYVVTDYVEKKVPVKREEIRVERDPPEESTES